MHAPPHNSPPRTFLHATAPLPCKASTAAGPWPHLHLLLLGLLLLGRLLGVRLGWLLRLGLLFCQDLVHAATKEKPLQGQLLLVHAHQGHPLPELRLGDNRLLGQLALLRRQARMAGVLGLRAGGQQQRTRAQGQVDGLVTWCQGQGVLCQQCRVDRGRCCLTCTYQPRSDPGTSLTLPLLEIIGDVST